MKDLWKRIWNSEPVVFVGAISTTWTAVVAFDKVSDDFNIVVWMYVVMIAVTVFLTAVTRRQVTAPGIVDED